MKQPKFLKNTIRGGVTLAIVAFSSSVNASNFNWNDPNGGLFLDGINWNPFGPPGVGDTAIFQLPNTYTVDLTGNVVNDSAFVRNSNLTLDLGSNNYSTNSALRVLDGSTLQLLNGNISTGTMDIRNDIGTSTQAIVGLGATLTANSSGGVGIDVGPVGQGTLNVINGGIVNAVNSAIRIGDSVDGVGIVNVGGSGSSLTGTDLLVAINGQGTLNVTNGGTVVANDISVGDTFFGPTGTGTVLVDGVNSTLTSAEGLFMRNNSTLNIQNGGEVELQGNSFAGAGVFDSNINITGGGKLIAQRSGDFDDQTVLRNVNATVSGNGSTLRSDDLLRIDDGSFTINSGAEVLLNNEFNQFGRLFSDDVEDEVVVTVNGGSRLMIGANPTPNPFAILPDLILSSRSGVADDQESILEVSDADSSVEIERSFHVGGLKFIDRDTGEETIRTRLPGRVFVENGAKMTIGETLILFGESTFNLDEGTANIGAGPEPTIANTLRVGVGGNLEGTGTVNGNVINDGGTVAPGISSAGRLAIGGNYTQETDGTFVLEISGTGTGEYDQLFASGDISLNGTLELVFIEDFLPQTDDLFLNIFSGLNLVRDFDNVSISGIAPDWEFEFLQDNGNLSIRSLSDAQSPNPIPEPSGILGLSVLALGGVAKKFKHKLKQSKSA